MRLIVLSLAAALGLGIGSISAVAAAGHHKAAPPVSQYDVASTNVDLAQTKLRSGDVASARVHLEAAKASTAACDADATCKARVDHFNLHARLEQTARRVALWEKK
ncbi:MAG: hypothetical protein KIT84_32700 [Labilithrix sp.]|nr:hypothetical protein [Labilithrix sp.]MCW5815835.1 hypothetical protein [Labilithrix sp.]